MTHIAVLNRRANLVREPQPESAKMHHTAVHPLAQHEAPAVDGAQRAATVRGQDLSQVPTHIACPIAPTRCPFGGSCHSCPLPVQRSTADPATPEVVPPIVHEVLRSPGQPLDPAARGLMELRFGQDFSRVRVHTDSKAAESARMVNAIAYTVGREIVFDAERYAPNTGSGRQLLAHELTHVAQQALAGGKYPVQIGAPNIPAEREAAINSAAVIAGRSAVSLRSEPSTTLMCDREEEPESREEESPGFWGTIWGGLIGEWNEDPSFAMIGVDLGVSLIPILDQASDARDLAAHLFFMIFRNQYNRFMRWVGLIFSLIGLIPEVGSAIKGASKFVIKGIREVLSHLGDIFRPFRRFLPEMTDLNRLFRYISENWNRWVAAGVTAWNGFLSRVNRVVDAASMVLSRRIQFIRNTLTRIREMSPQKLRDAFAWARRQWDDISREYAEIFGRREVAATERAAARAQRQYQTRIDQAIADAEARAARRGENLMDDVQNPLNRRWIEANPRQRELAFDPVHRRFTDKGVDEARAALVAERQGIGTPPFRRDLTGRSGASDFIDGAGVHWDHYMPRGIDINHEVNSLYGKLTTKDQNVLFDATHIGPIYRARLLQELSNRLAREGKSDLINHIAFIGEELSEAARRSIRTTRIAGRVFEEEEQPAEAAP